MALAEAILTLVALCGLSIGFASFGSRILRAMQWEMASDGQQVVVSIAVGLIATEVLLFFFLITQHTRAGCLVIVVLLCGLGILEWKATWERFRSAFRRINSATVLDKVLLLVIVAVLSVEYLASQAPLSGSDALHYHFTVQKETLQEGFHPLFSNSHSFLCGQHHLLILFGLALGSEHLALGFIFLGGVFTVASLACLTSCWTSSRIAAAFSLLFLLTPVIFWQMTSSGSPDIFMAFLATAAVLVLRQEAQTGIWRQALLAGFLAGGVAGAKYTGCVIAGALAIAVSVELRSAAQLSLFFVASLASGIWTYLRNLIWTGNPLFPFLSTRVSAHLATTYALTSLMSDTGASLSHDPWKVTPFIFLAAAQKNSPGLWDFFGPTVLALAPLTFLAISNVRAWRVPLVVWLLSSLGLFFSSSLPRFLLPVFPIALSCAAAGLAAAFCKKWAIAGKVAAALLFLMALGGALGLAIYSKQSVRVALGLQTKTRYLEQRTQDYEIVETVNRLLAARENKGRALVFVRHLYYLNVPYLNGDPETSFEVDPEHLRTTREWKSFFDRKGITYVVRSPNYPEAIAAPLRELERAGDLVPIAETEVEDLQGKRIDEKRVTVAVVILKIRR